MIKRFLSYVEIMTKITSLFAFLMTIAFLFYLDRSIDWKLTIIFFASMFIFDLTTTAINNYMDTKTNTQVLQFKRSVALFIIFVLLIISTALGLWLVFLTDIVVLLVGGLCFIFGVLYTYGPVPISRQPLGELFSGIFYGLLIPFIILYINMPADIYLTLVITNEMIDLNIRIIPILILILLSINPICTTANIMLANNICDLDKDILVKRFTLPFYIGKKALYLFALLYYLCYIANILLVVFKILPIPYLLTLFTFPIVQKNINTFFKKQEKSTTFTVAIKNYILIMGANTIMIFLCGLLTK